MLNRFVGVTAGLMVLLVGMVGLAQSALPAVAQVGYASVFTIDGKATGSGIEPATSSKPCFAGEGVPGSAVTLRVEPAGGTLSATVGTDGKYQVCQAQPLAPGAYQVFVNDQLLSGFKVAAPQPPATGGGLRDEVGGSRTLLLALLAAIGVTACVMFLGRRRHS